MHADTASPSPLPAPVLAYQARLRKLAQHLRAEIPQLREGQRQLASLLPPPEEQERLLEHGDLPYPFRVWADTDELVHLLCGPLALLEATTQATPEQPDVPLRSPDEVQREVDPEWPGRE